MIIANALALKSALDIAADACGTMSALPQLAYARIFEQEDQAFIAATDTDVTAVIRIPDARISGDGVDVLVQARQLQRYVRALDDVEVSLYPDGSFLVAHWQRGYARMPVLDRPELLAIPELMEPLVAVPAQHLKLALGRAGIAVSRERMVYALECAKLELREHDLRLVGTDGRRMSIADVPGARWLDEPRPLSELLPLRAMALAEQICSGDDIEIAIGRDGIQFHREGALLHCRRHDGNYPDYQRVISRKESREITLNVAEFEDAITRAMQLSSRITRCLRLEMGERELAIRAASDDGEADEALEISGGVEFRCGVNALFLLDCMRQMRCETMRFRFGKPSEYLEFVAVTDGPAFRHIIMPMRSE